MAQIHVSGNQSLTRRGAFTFFGIVTASSLTVAGIFAAQGYWPVLPFAGLELFALGLALGYSMRKAGRREVISVYADEVVIEQGEPERVQVARFQRHWAHTRSVPPRGPGRRGRLYVCAHGRETEVGHMLTETARAALARRLAGLIGGIGLAPEDHSPAGRVEHHQNEANWD